MENIAQGDAKVEFSEEKLKESIDTITKWLTAIQDTSIPGKHLQAFGSLCAFLDAQLKFHLEKIGKAKC